IGVAIWAGSRSVRPVHTTMGIVLGLLGGQVCLHLSGIDRAIVDPNPARFLRRIAGSLCTGLFLTGILLTLRPGVHEGYPEGLAAWILSAVFVMAVRPILRSLIRRHRLVRTLMILGPGELSEKLY